MSPTPAPSAKRPKTPTMAAPPAPSGIPAPSVPEAGRETDVPKIWPFPEWNGIKLADLRPRQPRRKVARKVSQENWEDAPF